MKWWLKPASEQGKKKMEGLAADFQRLRVLWNVCPPDCRWALLCEFLFDPGQLRVRYEEESKYQETLRDVLRDDDPEHEE